MDVLPDEVSQFINEMSSYNEEELENYICANKDAEIEKLIFPPEPRSFNLLDARTSDKVVKASNGVDSSEIVQIVICQNCEEKFSPQEFEMHLCEFDSDHKRITAQVTKKESELRKKQKSLLELMKENQAEYHKLKTGGKSLDGYECTKCCRKFVHYNGMYRHWDSHIGELVPEAEPEDPKMTSNVTLCIFCGEIFSKCSQAFSHLEDHHVQVMNLTIETEKQHVSSGFFSQDGSFEKKFASSTPYKNQEPDEIVTKTKWNRSRRADSTDIFDCRTQELIVMKSSQEVLPTPDESAWKAFEALISASDETKKENSISESPQKLFEDLNISGISPLSPKTPTQTENLPALDLEKISEICKDLAKNSDDTVTVVLSEVHENFIQQKEHSTPTSIHQEHDPKSFLQNISVTKLFQCEFCDSIFSNPKALLSHSSSHAPSSAFQCNTCGVKNLSLKDILLHRLNDCIIFRDRYNSLKHFPRVWMCNVCGDEFRGLEQLIEHRHSTQHMFPRKEPATNNLEFMCELCLAQFPQAPAFVEHVDEKHKKKVKENEVAETSERIKKSPSKRRGGIHQTSTRPRQYLCEVCGKSYTQSSHLWQHLRFHQGVKPFVCEVEGCGRRFTIRPDLSDHVRKCHTGERPYLCTICDKRFLTGSVFYQHRLIHRNERRYGCEECGKRFYRADALRNHTRIHTGEKPYKCTECSKEFRQRGDRDKHMKARHPNAEIILSPKKPRVKSFGRGRVKNNTSLYHKMPKKDNTC